MGKNKSYSRRGFMIGIGGGSLALAGCGNGINSDGGAKIDARVEATLNQMYAELPDTRTLASKAAGMLVMPLVTEAGFGIGGAYGRGALKVNGITVDYYDQAKASFGLQIGAQQYAHVLFFMTDNALANFRVADGWVAGADIKYALATEGGRISTDTIALSNPVVAVVFGQAGMIVGASLEGSKYTRIIP
ncbi:MAG: YSC84-related protein [Maritimibacter sp.]|jgi:lipid-binding SYLF domain-containing protein